MAYRTLPHGRESGLPSVPHFVVSAAAAAAATAESLPGNGASRYPERSSRPSTQDGMRQVVALQEEDEEEEEEEEEEGEEEELGVHRAAAQMADLADCDLPHRGLDAQRGLQGHLHLLPPGDGEQQQEGKGGGQDMKSKLSLLNETVNIKLGAPTWLSSSSSTNLRKQQQASFVDGEQGRKWCGCEAGSQCVQCSFLHLHAYPAAAGPPPASHPSAAPSTQWLSTSMAMASKAPQPGGGGGAAEVLGEDVPSDSIMALSAQQSHGSADINQSSSAQGRGLLEMHSDTANSSDLVEGDAGEQDTRNIWQNAGLKAEILSHPLYEQLLAEHVACLRVATPVDQLPRIDAQLDQSQHVVAKYSVLAGHNHLPGSEEKEELDQFMTHYVLLLCSFKEQLQQHVRVHAMEAVMACWELEQSLLSLTGISPGEGTGATMSDDDDDQEDSDLGLYDTGLDGPDSGGFGPLIPTETERSLMERVRQELKTELKQGYRERIVDVREEILRKRRAGKLPGDTTSVLKSWWQSHCKWPYPTEEEKARLVQETGLQLKQINNWFINQRKRNWHSNPSSSSLKNKRKR